MPFRFVVYFECPNAQNEAEAQRLLSQAIAPLGNCKVSPDKRGSKPRAQRGNKNTNRAYIAAEKRFRSYRKQIPCSSQDLIEFLDGEMAAGRQPTTVLVEYHAIMDAHRRIGSISPLSPEVIAKVREIEAAQRRRVVMRPAMVRREDIGRMLDVADANPNRNLGLRDRALLLLVWELRSVRRAVLSGLTFEGVTFHSDGNAQIIFSPDLPPADIQRNEDPQFCCVTALREWRRAVSPQGFSGPIIRSVDRHGNILEGISGHGIKLALNRLAGQAAIGQNFKLHSFRRSTVVKPVAIVRTGVKGAA